MAPSFTEELVRDPLGLFRHATGPKPFLPLGGGPECGPRLQRDTSQAPLLRVSSGQVWPMAGGGGQPLKGGRGQGPTARGHSRTPPPPPAPPSICLRAPGAFCGTPRCLGFLSALKFLKLVPQFRDQSPVTTMNLKPPPLQEGWACLSPSSLNIGRMTCFEPVPPGKTRVASRERPGVVGLPCTGRSPGGCSLPRSQAERLHKESDFSQPNTAGNDDLRLARPRSAS